MHTSRHLNNLRRRVSLEVLWTRAGSAQAVRGPMPTSLCLSRTGQNKLADDSDDGDKLSAPPIIEWHVGVVRRAPISGCPAGKRVPWADQAHVEGHLGRGVNRRCGGGSFAPTAQTPAPAAEVTRARDGYRLVRVAAARASEWSSRSLGPSCFHINVWIYTSNGRRSGVHVESPQHPRDGFTEARS